MSITTQDTGLENNHWDAAGLVPKEPVQRRHSERITVVQLLILVVPLSLCISKAASVVQGQSALPNRLD